MLMLDGKLTAILRRAKSCNGDVVQVERNANVLKLFDTFAGCDLATYEADLSQLAHTIARSWRGLLRAEFPERSFEVEVSDDEQSYGPEVTFFHKAEPRS
jgi:hypothetical protein